MLKKLARYGNSTTLVIDKAILELLNMDESSIVKLHTDGRSLIITPVKESNTNEKISYENSEALLVAKEAAIGKMIDKKINKDALVSMQKDFSDIFAKYNAAFIKFSTEISLSENFQSELATIVEKYDPAVNNEQYLKEYNKLKWQFCPELEQMDNEITAIHNKSLKI